MQKLAPILALLFAGCWPAPNVPLAHSPDRIKSDVAAWAAYAAANSGGGDGLPILDRGEEDSPPKQPDADGAHNPTSAPAVEPKPAAVPDVPIRQAVTDRRGRAIGSRIVGWWTWDAEAKQWRRKS